MWVFARAFGDVELLLDVGGLVAAGQVVHDLAFAPRQQVGVGDDLAALAEAAPGGGRVVGGRGGGGLLGEDGAREVHGLTGGEGGSGGRACGVRSGACIRCIVLHGVHGGQAFAAETTQKMRRRSAPMPRRRFRPAQQSGRAFQRAPSLPGAAGAHVGLLGGRGDRAFPGTFNASAFPSFTTMSGAREALCTATFLGVTATMEAISCSSGRSVGEHHGDQHDEHGAHLPQTRRRAEGAGEQGEGGSAQSRQRHNAATEAEHEDGGVGSAGRAPRRRST